MNPNKYHALLLGADHKLAETLLVVVRLDGGVLGSAGSYADALRQMQAHPPDFIFLDLKSAEADCLNLLRQLKHHPLLVPCSASRSARWARRRRRCGHLIWG